LMKSRSTFYAQVQTLSFHTASGKTGSNQSPHGASAQRAIAAVPTKSI
jgi:hypothetical protein